MGSQGSESLRWEGGGAVLLQPQAKLFSRLVKISFLLCVFLSSGQLVFVWGSVQKLITVQTFAQNLFCPSQNSRVWILVFFSSSITNRLNKIFLNMSYACTEKTDNFLYFEAQNQKEIETGIKILPVFNLKMETNIPCKFFNKPFSSKKFLYILH